MPTIAKVIQFTAPALFAEGVHISASVFDLDLDLDLDRDNGSVGGAERDRDLDGDWSESGGNPVAVRRLVATGGRDGSGLAIGAGAM